MNAQISFPSRNRTAFRSHLSRLVACTLLAAGLFVVSSAFAPKAHAAGQTCTVTAVWYDQATSTNTARLQIFCSGVTNQFFSFVNNDVSCPSSANKSIDTLKVWASLASANQLAAHAIFIDFNSPSGTCTVQTINNIRTG